MHTQHQRHRVMRYRQIRATSALRVSPAVSNCLQWMRSLIPLSCLMRSGCHVITLSGFSKRSMSTVVCFKATALRQLRLVLPDGRNWRWGFSWWVFKKLVTNKLTLSKECEEVTVLMSVLHYVAEISTEATVRSLGPSYLVTLLCTSRGDRPIA